MIKVCYGGRFHPPHMGHYEVYRDACRKFDNVFVVSSDTTGENSPFTLEDKKLIWKRMFDVNLIYSKNPAFYPDEIVNQDDIYITVCGEKDESRYKKSTFYKEYDSGNIKFSDGGYYYKISSKSNGISGTLVRENIKYNKDYFISVYGKFDSEIFDLINERLP